MFQSHGGIQQVPLTTVRVVNMPRSKQEALRRKKNRGRMQDPPLPILLSQADMLSGLPCIYFTGYLQGSAVIVRHSGDMEFLYNKGFFGKGSFSRSEPTFDSRQQRVNIPRANESSMDSGDTISALVTNKRKYLAHLRYKALSDDEESEYNDICLHEHSELSAFEELDEDEGADDEEVEEEEEEDEDSFNNLGGMVPTFKKLTPAELSNLPKQYLTALMTQVSLLTKEQIATFVRVPHTLAELENKYKVMRQKQLEYLGLSTPGPNSGPLGQGFGKKGVINLEEGEVDAVVILNSDDDDDDDDDGGTHKEENVEVNDKANDEVKVKAWDDPDNEGDMDFWGMGDEGEEKGEKEEEEVNSSENVSIVKNNDRKSDTVECDEQETQNEQNESYAKLQKENVRVGSGINDGDEGKDTKIVDGDGMSEGFDDKVSVKGGGKMEETEEAKEKDNDIDEGDGSREKKEEVGGRKEQRDLMIIQEEEEGVISEHVDKQNDKCEGVDEHTHKSNHSNTNEDIGDGTEISGLKGKDVVTTADGNTLFNLDDPNQIVENAPETVPAAAPPSSSSAAANDDYDSSDDDVICVEEDSAQPAKLHQYLSQSSASSKPRPAVKHPPPNPGHLPLVTKSVCFLSSVLETPKLISAKVGFASWDKVLHFNYTGDQTHLPTAMGVHQDVIPDGNRVNLSSACKVVYERIHPQVTSLVPSSNSKGSVIKQRMEEIPHLDVAQASLQHIFKTPTMVSTKEFYSSHLSLPHLSAGMRNVLQQQGSMAPTFSKNKNPFVNATPSSLMSRSHHSLTNSTPLWSRGVSVTSTPRPEILRTSQSYVSSSSDQHRKFSSFLQSKGSSHLHNVKSSSSSLSTKPSSLASSLVDLKPSQLELYLEVFHDDIKHIASDKTDKSEDNHDETSLEPKHRSELEKLRAQLAKTGLLTKSGKSMEVDLQTSNDSGAKQSPVSVFNNMLSDYMLLKGISLEHELALLRVVMYENSTNSNTIPKEFVTKVKSKLSPGQVSCLLERMDYVQNRLESDGKSAPDEVITIDLSDEETIGIKDVHTVVEGQSSNGENVAVAVTDTKGEEREIKTIAAHRGENDSAEKDLESSEMNGVGESDEKESKKSESESANCNSLNKRKLDCSMDDSVEHQSKKLKSGVSDAEKRFDLDSDVVEKNMKDNNEDEYFREDEDNNALTDGKCLSMEAECKDTVENIVEDKSVVGKVKDNNEDTERGDVNRKNMKNVSEGETAEKSQDSKNRVAEVDNFSCDKSHDMWNIVVEQASSVQNETVKTSVNLHSKDNDSDIEMLEDIHLTEVGHNETMEVEKIVQKSVMNLKGMLLAERKDEKNIDDGKGGGNNEIYVGSSDDDDGDGGDFNNVKRKPVFPWKKRDLFSGNKFHPYSLGDAEDGDNFVIANTSEDEENEDDVWLPSSSNGNGWTRQHKKNKWRPCLKKDPYPANEHLHLMLEEAFFLTYGLGCLRVLDQGLNPMKITTMWQKFVVMQDKFIPRYVAYHYFRSKGWVPKAGLKFGCDFILYREGPPFYHGSYSIVVVPIREGSLNHVDLENGDLDFSRRWTSWISLSGLNRITEHVSKELMLCYVIFPKEMTEEESKSPRCISRFKVKEVVVSRWVSAREREVKDQQEEMP